MISVRDLENWLTTNQDADTELTAHRLHDLIRGERRAERNKDALAGLVKTTVVLGIVAVVLYVLVQGLRIDHFTDKWRVKLVAEQKAHKDTLAACTEKQDVLKGSLDKAGADLKAALDSKRVLDEHVQLIAEACKAP